MNWTKTFLLSSLVAGLWGANASAQAPDASAADRPIIRLIEDGSPNVSIYSDALYLHRSKPQSSDPSLEVFDFGYQPGWQVGMILKRTPVFDIEARYFQIDNWSDSQNVGESFVVYESELRSAELNGRWKINNWLTALAGFRYVNFEEDVGVRQTDAFITLHSSNNMYGLQIGGDVAVWTGHRLSVNAVTKAGIYYNDASFNFAIFGTDSGSATFSNQDATLGFLGEVGLSGTYQVTQSLAIRGGYQAMWLSGVDTVLEHATSDSPLDPTIKRGDVFFHGGFLGIEFRW